MKIFIQRPSNRLTQKFETSTAMTTLDQVVKRTCESRLPRLMCLALCVAQLNGCGWLFGDEGTFRDRGNDYRNARMEKPISLPESIGNTVIYDSYAVPPITDNTTLDTDFKVPPPEPLSDDVGRDAVKINSLSGQRWILVKGSPGQIWPRLRGFLNLNQLAVQRVDTENGLLETEWLQPSTVDTLRERYRIRIEQGVQRDTSEVYILQVDIGQGEEDWPQQSSSDDREKILVTELAQYLANSAEATAVSMLAQQTIDSSGRISMAEDSQRQPYIKLQLPFSRAWASLRKALDRAGFTIDDLNRSQKLYYVSYSEEQASGDKPGFFASLFSSKDKTYTDTVNYFIAIEVVDGELVHVNIKRQDNAAMTKSMAESLLKSIKRHIS